jgi:hypothetical protein
MKKKKNAAARRGSALSEGSVRNDEHELPRNVAALFAGLFASSTRAAQADHRLQTKVTQAAARLRREQIRLLGAQARQVGVSELVKALAAAQERQMGIAIKAIEASHRAAAGTGRAANGRKRRSSRGRS